MKSNLRGEIIKDSHVYLYAHAIQHPRGLVYLKTLWGILMYLRMTMPLQKFCICVIPCQINKEFRITSRILTKLGVFVVPVVLITHANF